MSREGAIQIKYTGDTGFPRDHKVVLCEPNGVRTECVCGCARCLEEH